MHNELTSHPQSYSPRYQEGKECEEKTTEKKKQVEMLYYSTGIESGERRDEQKNKSGKKNKKARKHLG